MALDRFRAFARTQVGRAYRPTPPPAHPRAAADATTTAKILQVGQVREIAPRTAPIPLPATYPDALPPKLERLAEALTLTAQGRLSYNALVMTLRYGAWGDALIVPHPRVMGQALDYLRRWESHYAALMEAPCPPGMRCPDVGLCPWHRKILRQWFDRLHPVVRAAADPQTFEAAVAPLLTDLPRSQA